MNKIRILQINATYDFRSTGRITSDIHRELLKDTQFEPYVIYGRGKKSGDKNVFKVVSEFYGKFMNLLSRVTGMIFGQCFIGTKRTIKLIKRINPDLVHIQCPNGYFINIPKLILFLKKNNYKTLFTQHCEFFYTGNCGYSLDCIRWKTEGCGKCPRLKDATGSILFDQTKRSFSRMKKAFSDFEKNSKIVSCTPWLNEQANQSLILRNFRFGVVYNGADTDIFYHKEKNYIREKYNLSFDTKILVYVNPVFSDPTKYGSAIFDIANKLKKYNFKIFLIGNDDSHYDFGENIINVGKINDSNILSEYYSSADVSLILSKRECFPMTIVEALCCGTKVVGFKCFGPDKSFDQKDVCLVNHGDLESLVKIIMSSVGESENVKKLRSERMKELFSKKTMANEYKSIYLNMVLNNENRF